MAAADGGLGKPGPSSSGNDLSDLKPGDYVLRVLNGDDHNTYRLAYAVIIKKAEDYFQASLDDCYVQWYAFESVGEEESDIVVAPVWAFVARLTPAQACTLQEAGWPNSFRGLLDALTGA